jgi:exodeoxyribonuclease VII large subunit
MADRPTPDRVPERTIYTVSGLNAQVKDLLENSFPPLWVEGEISNFSAPASGHWYLSLKDEQAQVRCAMFRNRNQGLAFRPQNGLQVLVRARISLYAPRGEFQLILEHMEPAGEGALRRAFEQLKQKLQAEGLFEPARKKPLPPVPQRIGVITSPTGAAIRDILNVLRRRYPLGEVVIYPVPVQGTEAAPAIVRALATAAARAECDVLVLARGGGSLEDLWAFNEEAVARAIAACPLPVVSGVGHEIDFTIADFVADLRAPTPSAAAELVSPDAEEWRLRGVRLQRQLQQAQQRRLLQLGQQREFLLRRLAQLHPGRRLEQLMQRLDEFELRLARAARVALQHQQAQLKLLRTRLRGVNPQLRILALRQLPEQLENRLRLAAGRLLERKQHALALLGGALDRLSPLKTLERGYAIASLSDGRVLTDAASVQAGDALALRLHRGSVDCQVTATQPGKTKDMTG